MSYVDFEVSWYYSSQRAGLCAGVALELRQPEQMPNKEQK